MTNVSIEENVVIHTVAGRALTVDIFRPVDTPSPVQGLLFLPGGGMANRQPCSSQRALRYTHGPAWLCLCHRGVPRYG